MNLADAPQWLVLIVALTIGYLARRPTRRAVKRIGRAIVSTMRHLIRIVRIVFLPPGGTLVEPHPDGSVWKVERTAPSARAREERHGGQRR